MCDHTRPIARPSVRAGQGTLRGRTFAGSRTHAPVPDDPRVTTASTTRPLGTAAPPSSVSRSPISRRHPIVLAVALTVLYLLLAWIGSSFVVERLVYHPRRWDVGPPPSTRGWAYQDVAFRDRAGLTLRGWWIPGTGDLTIVMAHGWTSSRRQPYDDSAYLHAAGYNLLIFDFRGHGRSDGSYTTIGWAEPDDLRAAVDYARSRSRGPLAVIGYSMGAVAALEEAAADPRVGVVVADSPFADLASEQRYAFENQTRLPVVPFATPLELMARLDLGYDPARVRPVEAAGHLRQPMLVIVGASDTVVPPAQGYAVFHAAHGPKQLLAVPGADHVGAYDRDPTTYARVVLGFLRTDLRPS